MKTLFFTVILVASCIFSNATNKIAIGNTGQGWSNGNNFSPTGVPQSGDSVTIPAGVTLTVKGNIYGTLALLKIYVYGTMDFDPSGKLDLTVSSLVQIHSGGRITTNGSSSEIIAMGGVVKYNGQNDGTVEGPKYASAATSFSNGIADDAGFNFGVLPIDILSFTLRKNNNHVMLTWLLNRSADIDHSVVQKRTNGTWKDIQKDELNNPSALATGSYSYTDKSPEDGENFYRLKLVRKDGKIEYSHVLMANLDFRKTSKSFYPNPVKTKAVFSFPDKVVNGKISLFTMSGMVVYEKNIPPGEHQVEVDFSTLKKGLYYAVVMDNNTVIERSTIIFSN